MDSISELPNALLLKILSLLPTKDVVATMVLSKRWKLLWMMVPRLIYDDDDDSSESFPRFVDRSLLLHEAPFLETLHFKLSQNSGAIDIRVWTRTALKRQVRELIIEMDCCFTSAAPVLLPRRIYTECNMLVKLKLKNVALENVSYPISFPSLKELSLLSVKYSGCSELVHRLLSNCPVLEDLVVEQCPDDNVTIFTVKVPSLKSLVFHKSHFKDVEIASGFVIDTPSLEFLDLLDYEDGFCLIDNEMPDIVEAVVNLGYSHLENVLSSFTSAKYLSLCLSSSKDAYLVGNVFDHLVKLKICTCETEWLNLLMCILRDSPKLQSLKLEQVYIYIYTQTCVLSTLVSLDWVKYGGTKEEEELIAFMFRSGSCLKRVTINSKSTIPKRKKLKMLKELPLLFMCSPSCQLVLN
ncbi:hypothetical protein CARUB_v10009307mg [Capsella rubella]|uniref:F-box domain-containing protein n=1 Tax=Capsella rubella TaxID=81985 RepID=R0GXB5_9BRAS|nr:probable FBD-associated F-box protein At1g32375 [Capsella rubella]XP_023632653.1 probable FBD-associated F-box protein At1g32375 [Capsella rubella]EOA40577.1 hypothetical protein CARUB_v10009307mg [Capsella rubella]